MIETVNSIGEIKGKELRMLRKVLDRYGLKAIDIKKARSAYKITTDKRTICLKKMKHEFKKVQNGNYLVRELNKNNFNNTIKYIKTKDDKLTVYYRNLVFYATEWIDGDECNLNDINEAINCAKFLAKFHLAAKNIDTRKFKMKTKSKNWIEIFTKCVDDMEKFRYIIDNKRIKNEFDIMYEKLIDKYYERGIFSIKILNESSYIRIIKNINRKKSICHNSFYYQNIIKNGDNYYIIDLDSIILDLPINDLGKMIRRLMTKKEYMWDFNKAKSIIEAYSSVNKLTIDEIEIMLSLIIFPHKFWKIGNKRYVKHKNWSECKYMKKLNKIVLNDDYEKGFIKKYMEYIQKYN
ncbi:MULTISPECIES: CotS family spore coat protein [Clostridium]|uniref:CotS family spore coat protein n=1 Tax=Clostridium TaxID=1485 RepID=UPI000826CBC2|nr:MULTISPECIES: CotS family spore coat protein [Clostridium]PJI10142.1 CotS family spore coat protein [Clostridium sp. CT7]